MLCIESSYWLGIGQMQKLSAMVTQRGLPKIIFLAAPVTFSLYIMNLALYILSHLVLRVVIKTK